MSRHFRNASDNTGLKSRTNKTSSTKYSGSFLRARSRSSHFQALSGKEEMPLLLSQSQSPPRLGSLKLEAQSRSVGTITTSTISCPNTKQMVSCLALALHSAIKKQTKLYRSLKKRNPDFDHEMNELWDENVHPLDTDVKLAHTPSGKRVYTFLLKIFSGGKLSAQVGVMAFVYIDRFLKLGSGFLLPNTWRRIALAAILIASKVWEDLAVWNEDYLSTFSFVTLEDLSYLEQEFLATLEFGVAMSSSEYARYYFDLRSLYPAPHHEFLPKPLTNCEGRAIESSSAKYSINLKSRRHRSASLSSPRQKQ